MPCVKICGITNLEDARAAASAGADLLGFVFAPNTPRSIEPARARAIIAAVHARASALKCVGVFVNESLEHVRAVMEATRLDLAQLHGNEPARMVRALSPRVYKALRPRDADDARARIEEYRAAVAGNVPAFILDTFDPNKFGGTGVRADWGVAARVAREFPILLAGGLNVENVAEAVRIVQPWGVDVSSGVESAPGRKDHAKVRQFIEQVKTQRC